jgi:AcrR family transcriptional regulator
LSFEDDRESILAAALEEVENGGLEKLATRSVAAKLGLAPNALYRYFENLSALELATAEEVRFQMLGVLQKVIGKGAI